MANMDSPIKIGKTRSRQLVWGLIAYAAGSLALALITFSIVHRHLTSDIDRKLSGAVNTTRSLLGENLHKRNMTATSLSKQRDYEISMRLTDFVERQGLAYVYSMIEKNGEILFITSSATREEIENDSYIPAYFMRYPEAVKTLHQVFLDGETRYAEYTDRWGIFRSIFVSFVSADGQPYVIGADINLDQVTATAWQSAVVAFLACLGLGLVGFPLIFLYVCALQRETKFELHQMVTCPLTGLPNRLQLLKDLEGIETAHISVINIDRFSEITALYGPGIGDDILKQFSMRLKHVDPTPLDNYQAYRLYADEFAVLVTGKHDRAIMETKIGEMYKQLTIQPYLAIDTNIKLRIRIGAAVDGEEAFTMADMALREAKNKNESLVLYDSQQQLPAAYQRNFELTQLIRNALEQKRFVTYYQPLLNTTTGDFDKYECLARLIDEEGKIISYPCEFLPVAYRSRLYHRFSLLMLSNIFQELHRHDKKVSINISISDIKHKKTNRFIFEKIANRNIAKRIEFEILENENIEDINEIRKFITKVRACGCRVGLDDLGKDYSNIDRLMALPVDFIKIDGNIIRHLALDKDAQNVARMIISFAYKRKIETVAEYCCDGKTSDIARRLGVDYLQGFHIGEPHADLNYFSAKTEAGSVENFQRSAL